MLEILEDESIDPEDRIWAASRKRAMPENLQRLCAVASILNTKTSKGSVLDLMEDERSKKAVAVAERHARGEASDEELAAARDAAWAAAWDAARDAARDAAWDAARDAARDSARDAARDAARAAAWDAAKAAARDAARAAARDAAWDAAWAAAWAAARDAMPLIWAATIRENLKG